MKNALSILGKFLPLTTMMLALVLCFTSYAEAEQLTSGEYQVKAVFLLNFAKFTQWPAGAFANEQSSIVLGICGDDDFGDALNAIDGKTAKGRKLVIRKLGKGGNLQGCHILFISSSEKWRLQQILSELADQPVLTVGDMDHFAEQGGIISLRNEGKKIRLTINLASAQRADLKISSQLLNIATIVGN
ncbi:MAG: YfiR family protein [Proteobacteria bacterium]|nr:YfiR family protein [Pseudomonadota bacterium]MBU0966237.1 YfiR family protein [Pseudomonadota bacterium]